MFNKGFVCAIGVNGKILRENSQIVMLPFGAEYDILLKNLNSRRAMVKVSVDGKDATEGTRLIIQANSSINLERYIRNGNLSAGNKFKFIERTAAVEKHRGVGSDDGLVRAEFWAEKERATNRSIYGRSGRRNTDFDITRSRLGPSASSGRISGQSASGGFRSFDDSELCRGGVSMDSSFMYESTQGGAHAPASIFTAQNMNMADTSFSKLADVNDAGITVPGSESTQEFQWASGFEVEASSTVIVLQLRGQIGKAQVTAPVTVQYKPTCTSCGKTNKAVNKFCSECGTALHLI